MFCRKEYERFEGVRNILHVYNEKNNNYENVTRKTVLKKPR
jgi:hypothetical protein